MSDKKELLRERIKAGQIGYYMCDPSCGLTFLLSKDGNHTCPQCNREVVFMRDAKLSDLE